MAGIYIHIPFCKQACHYCNFHFSTSLRMKEQMLEAIIKELDLQKNYLDGEKIETIYLGGGTPSLLSAKEVMGLWDAIHQHYAVEENFEFTLEANPDDLNKEKLHAFSKHTPINRLSIGIQSFFDADLKFMNRAHSADEAKRSISQAQAFGFHDISIDLIYGSPTTTHDMWDKNLERTFSLGIPHISSYCMTVEPGTALDHFVKKGRVAAVDEEKSAIQFKMLMDSSKDKGYEHYEISNFSLPGRYSRHNTSYWQRKKYLGIGPSAHSFNGHSRQWNIPNNAKYMNSISNENKVNAEKEILSSSDRYNEYIMTSLRTQWGVDIHQLSKKYKNYFIDKSSSFVSSNHILQKESHYHLSQEGKLIADKIAMELFFIEE